MDGKGIRDAIFILRMLVERAIEAQNYLFICFIDYSKAFDTVKHDKLFEILQNLHIDGKDIQFLQNLSSEG